MKLHNNRLVSLHISHDTKGFGPANNIASIRMINFIFFDIFMYSDMGSLRS